FTVCQPRPAPVRAVPSFPTRRSSDLWRSLQYFVGDIRPRLAMNLARNCCSRDEKMIKPGEARDPKRFATMDLLALLQDQKLDERSEEHTSELQSREKLVCRLLLEKTK